MTDKEYINLLEEAVTMHANAPANKVLKWEGNGDLPVTMDADEINYLVDKIVKGDGLTDKAIGSPSAKNSGVSVKEGEEDNKSPLSILENELEELGVKDLSKGVKIEDKEKEEAALKGATKKDISEDLDFTDQESDILSRLITEMGEMEANFSPQVNDEFLDTEIDDETIAPGEEYEMDELENY